METVVAEPPVPPSETKPEEIVYDWADVFARLTIEKVMVTPEMAQSWLSGNVRNRTISVKHVDKLIGIYNRGNWKFNGVAIVFDWNGSLVEGQHRLRQIVRIGQSLPCVIVHNVDPDAFSTYDLCRRRTLKDLIQIGSALDGDESPIILSAAIGYLAAYLNHKNFKISGCNEDQRLDVFDEHPEIRAYAKLYKAKNALRISGGLFACCHYLFAQKDGRPLADEFMSGVMEGEILTSDDPAWRFREWVSRKMGTKRTAKNIDLAGRTLFEAWNMFRRKDKCDGPLRPPAIMPEIE